MKTIMLITVFSLSLFSCAQETVKGNGNFETEIRNVSKNFDAVGSSGAFEVIINDAPQDGKIKLEGDANILKKINVEVKGNSLILETKKGFNLSFKKPIKITLNAQNLRSLALSGSGSILAKGTQNVEEFSVAVSGSGNIDSKVSSHKVSTAISGSGDITLAGKANFLSVGTSGSGDVYAFKLNVKDAEIGVSGSGDTELTVSGTLTGAISGSGDIKYKGNPVNIKVQSAGSGDIIDAN